MNRAALSILSLSEGTVKEAGTHHMLMEQNGIYADMYSKQAKNYLAISDNSSITENKVPNLEDKAKSAGLLAEGGIQA